MRKYFIIFGAIFIIFLMVSNATAVPQSNSKPIMKNISNRKQQISLLEERLEENIEKLNDIISNVQPKGLIDIILAIITAIIDLLTDIIYKLIDFIDQIQYLLSSLINAIQALIDKITEFIEWLQDLFNPESNTVIQ